MNKCRICGCTDGNACMPERCFWVEDDLCSSCAGKAIIAKHQGNPGLARQLIEAAILHAKASMCMSGEFFCELCGAHGDEQQKIEACSTRPCGFRDETTGEINAPYLDHAPLKGMVTRLEEALATVAA